MTLDGLRNYFPENISPALRTALETAYKSFRKAVIHKDPVALFANSIIRSSEREILQKKVESGDFSDFADWIAMMNPPLEDTHFVTVKTDGDDFAAYYFAWSPSYSDQYQNLSVRKFEKIADDWKMIYSFSGAFDVPLSVEAGQDLTAEILEAVETNPILKLNRPVGETTGKGTEPFDAALKDELKAAYDAYRQALLDGNLDSFLATTRISLADKKRLAKKHRKLFPEILAFYPPLSETTFVTVRVHDDELAGYFHIAPHPVAPEFESVVLIPFVRHDGQWKVLFSIETNTYMSLLSAKSEGDKFSRAFELIDQKGTIISLEGLRRLFEESLISDEQRDWVGALEAIRNNRYRTAVDLLEPLTEKGMAQAKTALGLLYSKGNGVRRDFGRAFELFLEASRQGDSDALYYLGYAYFSGQGVEADQTWALAYLMAADKLGHDRAEQEAEKAMAVLEDDIQSEARRRASALVSEILERRNMANS